MHDFEPTETAPPYNRRSATRASSHSLLSCRQRSKAEESTRRRRTALTVEQLKREEEKRNTLTMAAKVGRRMMSVRVSYRIVLAAVGWLAFGLAICFLRALGYLEAR